MVLSRPQFLPLLEKEMMVCLSRGLNAACFCMMTFFSVWLPARGAEDGQTARVTSLDNDLIFKKIKSLEQMTVISRRGIESLLGSRFNELPGKRNMRYFEISDKKISPHAGFTGADLRVNARNSEAILILDVVKTCPCKDDVLRRYPGAVISNHPRGHSLDEETSYTVERQWGGLTFGFKERSPECLSSVTVTFESPDVDGADGNR